MNYVYRFIDDMNSTLYIGKTNNIRSRMSGHFGKNGHLPEECLSRVARIDFKELDDGVNVEHIEKQLIRYFQPEFNQVYKNRKLHSIPQQHLEDWNVFKDIRPVIVPKPAPMVDKEVIPYKWGVFDNMFVVVCIILWCMFLYGVWNVLNDFLKLL